MNIVTVIETRMKEIQELVKKSSDSEELRKFNEELDALILEKKDIEETQERTTIANNLENGKIIAKEISSDLKEERKMNVNEIRNSKEYINAYAEYIKTGKDAELRALLTTNATSGTIAVPDMVYDIIKTSFEKNEIVSLMQRTEVKGNLKVQFEYEASEAVISKEGETISEGTIANGIATLVPAFINKSVSLSKEVLALSAEKFLEYVYASLTNKIVKKLADDIVEKISKLPATATKETPSANKISKAIQADTIATAVANLSDEAVNPVITMNKLTYATFKSVAYANNYAADIFENLQVKFNNKLPAYDNATAGDVYAVVGDYGYGTLANFPNGDAIDFIVDELTNKYDNLVEIMGQNYVADGVIADKAFALLAKPE